MIKLQIHVQDFQDLGTAVQVFGMVSRQFPNQETGNKGAVVLPLSGKDFTVVRNQDSYTVRGPKSD